MWLLKRVKNLGLSIWGYRVWTDGGAPQPALLTSKGGVQVITVDVQSIPASALRIPVSAHRPPVVAHKIPVCVLRIPVYYYFDFPSVHK